jgi:replicative DNA helicase
MARMSGPLDRIPPQSLEAEQATLGSMMIARSAVEQAMELLQPEDFYRDHHRYIFEAISDLVRRDEPADLLTVAEELERQGRLEAIGGKAYLGAVIESVPTAAHCEFYAKRVSEKAVLRRLIDASGQIIAWAHDEEDEVDEIVDRAERLIFGVAQRHLSQYFVHIQPLLFEAMERLEQAQANHERITGVPTGFDVLDDMTAGLQPSDFVIVAGRPSMGKCVRACTLLDHPITGERLTIEEWVLRRVSVVLGLSDRGEVRPTQVADWVDSGVQPCYRVTTRTGRSVEVTGHHPFLTVNGWKPLHDVTVGTKIGVPRVVPAFGRDETWPSDLVRLLAYYIAEGGLSRRSPEFTNTDPAIVQDFAMIIGRQFPRCHVRRSGHHYYAAQPGPHPGQMSNPVTVWLRELGLMGKRADAKRFPNCVWQWSRSYLAEFLRALFSCDGTIYTIGGYPRIEFSVASEGLAEDVHHALVRFGIVAKLWQKKERCWRVEITEPESVARFQEDIGWLGEKAARCRRVLPRRRSNIGQAPREVWPLVRAAAERQAIPLTEVARRSGESVPPRGYNPHGRRGLPQNRLAAYAEVLDDPVLRNIAGQDIYWDEIVAIEAVGEHQVYDLTVPDGANFIAQDVCVHNTSLALAMGVNAAVRRNVPVALFSLEMSKEQLVQRMICSEAKVNAVRLRTGYLQDSGDGREGDWRKLTRAIGKLGGLPIYIDDGTDLTTREMRAKCRRLRAESGLGLVVVDYLQLIRGAGRTENRTQEISEIARDLKSLAREMKVPVVALSQLSRAVERREDKRPMLSDLRESGSIEAEADIVMMLYRSSYYRIGQQGEGEESAPVRVGAEDMEKSELIIAKHRNGPVGTVELGFLRQYARFENLADFE